MNRDELRVLVAARRAAFYGGSPCGCPPACAVCEDGGVVPVCVGPVDAFGNYHTEEAPCPACSMNGAA